jgi:hypothetical protein
MWLHHKIEKKKTLIPSNVFSSFQVMVEMAIIQDNV